MVNTDFLNKTLVLPTFQEGGKDGKGEYMRCYMTKTVGENGVWQEINPLAQSLPLFVMQLIIITSISRLVIYALKPLRQPRIVAEIIAGILLGNSGFGRFRESAPLLGTIFNLSRVLLIETMGNLGLLYYLFLLGLEMDLTSLPRIGKKSVTIAVAGSIFPFAVGSAIYFLCLSQSTTFPLGSIFWGVSLSLTGLPVLADILAKLKLLHSDFGKTAMSSALLNELISWVLFILVITISSDYKSAPWSLVTTAIFIAFNFFVVGPTILWIISKTKEGEDYSEATICLILTGVLACGLVTDFLGTSSMVGAFVFGLVIPNEVLGHRFVVVLQGFVGDLLMPVFFTLSGFRTLVDVIYKGSNWYLVGGTIFWACIAKFGTTVVVSRLFDMPLQQGFTLGVLMNTKGILAIIALNVGHDHLAMDDTGFVIMLTAIVSMTMVTTPIMSFLYKPTRHYLPSKHRALQKLKPDAELRILACVHEMQTVASTINLLRATNATKRSPIMIFSLQLIQITKHAAALLIVHSSSRNASQGSRSRADGLTGQIIQAFEELERECSALTVQPLTALSSFATMHEDICNVAEEKRVTLIIVPFHKRQTIHNKMEDTNFAYKDVNDNLLVNAPCSVGILVDRGFGASGSLDSDKDIQDLTRQIAMIYIGGPDDREALAYAYRMGGHPKARLTVVRLLLGENVVNTETTDGVVYVAIDDETERQLDDVFINEFRYKIEKDNSMVYSEKAANNGSETVGVIRSMGENFDLYVVGRGLGMFSPLTAGLDDWSECPELGAIGDLLLTSDFSSTASVLVVQQYAGMKSTRDGLATPDSSEDYQDNYGHMNQRRSRASFDHLVNQGDG